MINVMIVEDDPMAQKLLDIFVSGNSGYRVAHTIESAAMAEFYCMTHPIDLILMDVCTAMNISGLEAAEKIKARFPHIKIIIITSQPECSFIDRARSAGVESFWYKSASAEEILTVMDRTMAGESIYPDSTPAVSFGNIKSTDLSKREIEVLREVIMGFTNAEIAERLNLSQHTVRDYIQVIMEKTGYRTRTELAVKARETGIIIPDKKN